MRMGFWCPFYYLRLSDKYWYKGAEPEASAHNETAIFFIHLDGTFPFGRVRRVQFAFLEPTTQAHTQRGTQINRLQTNIAIGFGS